MVHVYDIIAVALELDCAGVIRLTVNTYGLAGINGNAGDTFSVFKFTKIICASECKAGQPKSTELEKISAREFICHNVLDYNNEIGEKLQGVNPTLKPKILGQHALGIE